MSHLCPHCNSFTVEDYSCWVSVEKSTQLGGVRYVQGSTIGSDLPPGRCANSINALKLVANEQEDGDGLLQNIVKKLGMESTKGLTDCLREFIKIDNERSRKFQNDAKR